MSLFLWLVLTNFCLDVLLFFVGLFCCCICLFKLSFCISGRIMHKRSSGAKLVFYDLHGGGFKVQVMADARY